MVLTAITAPFPSLMEVFDSDALISMLHQVNSIADLGPPFFCFRIGVGKRHEWARFASIEWSVSPNPPSELAVE